MKKRTRDTLVQAARTKSAPKPLSREGLQQLCPYEELHDAANSLHELNLLRRARKRGQQISGEFPLERTDDETAKHVQVDVVFADDGSVLSCSCECPFPRKPCVHTLSLLISFSAEPYRFRTQPSLETLLQNVGKDQLVRLLSGFVSEHPTQGNVLYKHLQSNLVEDDENGYDSSSDASSDDDRRASARDDSDDEEDERNGNAEDDEEHDEEEEDEEDADEDTKTRRKQEK